MTQHLQTMMCEYTTLIIMLYIGVRCLNQRNNKIIRLFSHFVFGVIAFQIINIPVRMVDAGLVRMPAAVVFVLNCGFMIAETFVTYEWFYFFESIQNSLFVEKKIIRVLRSIPLVLMIVLCVVSWWTGWLFYVDDTGMYRRGVLFALQVVLPYTYVFVTLVSAIVYSITRREKRSAVIITIALIPALICSVLQIIAGGSYVLAGLTLSAMFVYIELCMEDSRKIEKLEVIEKANHDLENALDMANKANNAKTVFLNSMSHDIRTPINGIRGMVEICRFYLNDRKKAEECLDKIMAASGFLLELVNDVLDMNKLESGEIVLTKEPFCLSKLLMEVDSVIEMQADESGVDYIKAPLNIENDHLIGSSLHIKQILQNIVSNAVKYNKRGGYVRVSCTENRIDEKNIMFEFVCTDNGQGMSEDFQKKAFEPFAQEKTRVRTTYAGTGLGLAISKKLTVQMGGTIEFISRQGYGTTFYVKIPFEIDDSYESRQQKISADEKIRLDGNKIIIAEDNELNMEIARFIIEGAGAQVMPAVNGEEAVKIFETSQYGEYKVVLMDVMMPVMGGLEAAQNIRKMDRPDAKTVAMIAMSANAFHDDVEQSLAAGMNVHMAKPLDFDKLLATIKEYCDKN